MQSLNPPISDIIHTGEDFKAALARHNVIQSLSGVGHCYDNARMESFFTIISCFLSYLNIPLCDSLRTCPIVFPVYRLNTLHK